MTDEIDLRDLTCGESTGSGAYDELMRTSLSHIQKEYTGGRITGANYSTVYLGLLQANLNAGLQFVLQAPVTNKQLLLLDEQILAAKCQNELLALQKEQLRLANETAQYHLDNTLPKQSTLLDKNALQADAQLDQTLQQTTQIVAQTEVVKKQEALVDEQIQNEHDKNTQPTGGINLATYNKILAEIAILEQKKLTEEKQTTGTVDDTGGLIGTELALKKNQAESFLRDAEQKASKLYGDIFSVMYATEAEGLDNQQWGFGSDEALQTMTKLLAGISAGTPDTTN